jgi:hypothetical protein
MNKQLIRDLAITGGIYDCICDPYDKLENGDYYSSVMVDLERFAEKIVNECAEVIDDGRFSVMECEGNSHRVSYNNGIYYALSSVKKHFGVEE